MAISENAVSCPKCGESISIDDVLTHQIADKVKKDFEGTRKVKELELEKKAEELRKRAVEISESRKDMEQQIAKRLSEEKSVLVKHAKEEAEKEQNAKTQLLEEQLKSKEEKLQQATQNEIELRKEKMKLDEEKQSFELDKMRQLEAAKVSIMEEASKRAAEDQKFVVMQLKKQLDDVSKAKDELSRKLEQGSQQTQGEALELELENILRSTFPLDEIVPVGKGIQGADIIQKVRDRNGRECGIIAWESKQTKAWSEGWVAKLKDDQRKVKAEIGVLITRVLPQGVINFGIFDGVWVTSLECMLPLAFTLRSNLIQLNSLRASMVGKSEKMEVIYNYLAGNEFKQKIEAIVEAFVVMQQDLEREKRAMQKLWSMREKQLGRVMENTSGMYGDLQGLMGGSLLSIESLELTAVEEFS